MWVVFVPKLDRIHLISFAHQLDSEEEALCIDQQYLKVHHKSTKCLDQNSVISQV